MVKPVPGPKVVLSTSVQVICGSCGGWWYEDPQNPVAHVC
jgi:hypothetical protein